MLIIYRLRALCPLAEDLPLCLYNILFPLILSYINCYTPRERCNNLPLKS
jgi:hypothetical protein